VTRENEQELLELLREFRLFMIWTATLSKEDAAEKIRKYAEVNGLLDNPLD
jgi:hypothetical protein